MVLEEGVLEEVVFQELMKFAHGFFNVVFSGIAHVFVMFNTSLKCKIWTKKKNAFFGILIFLFNIV